VPVPAGQYKLTNMDSGRFQYIKVTPQGQMLDGTGQSIQPSVWTNPVPSQTSGYSAYSRYQSQYARQPLPQSSYAPPMNYQDYSGYAPGSSYPMQSQYRSIPQYSQYGTYPVSGYSQPYGAYQSGYGQQVAQQPYQSTEPASTSTSEQSQQTQSQQRSKLSVLGGVLKGALGSYMRYKYYGY
jgi:hypothetical protein